STAARSGKDWGSATSDSADVFGRRNIRGVEESAELGGAEVSVKGAGGGSDLGVSIVVAPFNALEKDYRLPAQTEAAGSSLGSTVPDDIADGDTAPRSAKRTAGGDEHLGLSHDPYEHSATDYSIHGAAVPGQEWTEGGERNGTVTESGKGGAWDILLH
ncbi:hypothetical protein V501_04122, partial [Pseudogymnoascus sp. VKM F-4519 (FW-2642)]